MRKLPNSNRPYDLDEFFVNCNVDICYNTSIQLTLAGQDNRGVLVLLKIWVNSQKLGVQAPQNVEFE